MNVKTVIEVSSYLSNIKPEKLLFKTIGIE